MFRMLFIDFSSAFNTIIPQQLINKLNLLGLNNSLCNWILDFLTGRPQSVRVGHNTSSTTTLSTGAPQGCVLSPLLFTLLTHDCTAKFSSNHIIKFADDTTAVGLISNKDETHYREEVAQLAEWCGANNLSLNVEKTKEVVLYVRRRNSIDHPPLTIDSSTVERVSSTKFLDHQHHVTLQEGTTAPTLSPPAEKSKSPSTHPHHILQRHHWECADQLHHCLVRELQCCWPQDPPADSEHGCKDHRCPSPIHPGHFPCTMLQQNQQHREGPHPPLPQSYHQEDGTGASEPSPPDCSTAFSPRLWEPWTQITPPSSETPCKPLPPETWTPPPPPPPSKHPPTLPHQRKNCELFCAIQVCYTQVSGPVQITCSNTLSSMRTRHFSHTAVYTIPQKTQKYMYVYMLMHYKSSCTVPQQAAWLTMFLSAHVQYLCEAFV